MNLALGRNYNDPTTEPGVAAFGDVISIDTADAIAPVILGSVDFVLQEVTWAIGKLKNSVAGEARAGLENLVYKLENYLMYDAHRTSSFLGELMVF